MQAVMAVQIGGMADCIQAAPEILPDAACIAHWHTQLCTHSKRPLIVQTISVELRDVSEPLPLALPRYAGNIYIYAALVMGAIWMFSTVPLLAMFVVVLVGSIYGLYYRSPTNTRADTYDQCCYMLLYPLQICHHLPRVDIVYS